MTLIKSQVYTTTFFNGWTDGPKYVMNTKGNIDRLNLTKVDAVVTIKDELELDNFLHRLDFDHIATIYFINDQFAAEFAMYRRPDLNIINVKVDWDNVKH